MSLKALWSRLYAHAVLLESRIFPSAELCDESPDYVPYGIADTWKGNYHGELVYIKGIRSRYPTGQREMMRVCNSFIFSEVYSVRFLTDISSRNGRDQAQSSSKCTLSRRGFGDVTSSLHHESVDARREYHPVHQGESGGQSADAGTCISIGIPIRKTQYLHSQQLAQACQGLMYLHNLSVLHSGITPVGKSEELVNPHTNDRYV